MIAQNTIILLFLGNNWYKKLCARSNTITLINFENEGNEITRKCAFIYSTESKILRRKEENDY